VEVVMKSPTFHAKSITHEHLLSIANSYLLKKKNPRNIRILDVGCGKCDLIYFLHSSLCALYPQIELEVFGFDVVEHGAKRNGYVDGVITKLSLLSPMVTWKDRVSAISSSECWPYENGYFDFIFSNQVLEHVQDHDFLFSEIARTLKWKGVSAHLFPVNNCFFEGHLRIPLAHRIYNSDLLKAYIKFFIKIKKIRHFPDLLERNLSLPQLSQAYADYLINYTNYPSVRKCIGLGKKHKLRTSFRYTKNFYFEKMKSLIGGKKKYVYEEGNPLFDYVIFLFLRNISSITLFMEKENLKTQNFSTLPTPG
jgi:SAM-dependent methyltransferase